MLPGLSGNAGNQVRTASVLTPDDEGSFGQTFKLVLCTDRITPNSLSLFLQEGV